MTPIYQYPSINTFGGAFSGAMSAIGGGLAEIEAAKKSQARLAAMSDELAARGLTSDAAIYRNLADTETPNFLQAAIQGKPTEHNDAKMVDHALNILQKDRELAVKASTERDATLIPNISLIRQDIATNNQRVSRLQAENDVIQGKLANPSALNSGEEADGLKASLQRNNEEIARIQSENEKNKSQADTLLSKAGSGGSSVQTKGSDRSYYSENQNPGKPALPGEDLPFKSSDGSDGSSGPVSQLLPNNPSGENAAPTPEVQKATPVGTDIPGTTIPAIPVTPMSKENTIAAGINSINAYAPTSLASAIGTKPSVPATTKPSVTESSGSTDPSVIARESLSRDIASYKEAGGTLNPRDRKSLNAAWQKLKPPVVGDLVFSDAQSAHDKAAEFPDMKASIRPNSQGQTLLTLTPKNQSSVDSRIGAAYKNPENGNVYYVDNKQLRVASPDGSVSILNFNDQEQTAAKLREIVASWNRFNPDNKMLFVPSMSRQDVQQAAKSPVATPGNPGNSGGSSALDAWRASQKSSTNPPP